jgi:hypothetical protein
MTPKKKAEELVEKMMLYSYEKIENEKNTKYIVDNKIKKEYAKQCALIAVEEILNAIYNEDFDGHLIDEHNAASYWQEVKQEINKL